MNAVNFRRPNHDSLREEEYFIADLHHHTRYSHDSGTPIKHIIEQCEKLQIHVAITDHNSISGTLRAHETPSGRKWVIPGIEVTTKESKDVLVYFYNVEDLKKYFKEVIRPSLPQKMSIRMNKTTLSMKELLEQTRGYRCVIVLPHPCCARIKSTYHFFQNKEHRPLLENIDAIEVINETMARKNNLAALGWSIELGKPITAGSDGHRPNRVGEAITYAQANNLEEFLDAIKQGQTYVQGKELKPNERFMSAFHIIAQKARIRNNKRLDKEYQSI